MCLVSDRTRRRRDRISVWIASALAWHRSWKMEGVRMRTMVKLTWLPHWQAYVVRVNGRVVGLVRCAVPLPFRIGVQFA